MKPQEPEFVQLFVGVLFHREDALEKAVCAMDPFGPVDFRSTPVLFSATDYYDCEMGSPIYRVFLSFERLVHPKDLARIKTETNAIEESLAEEERRTVNLDPGIMDYNKVVLASGKYNGQKIYLDSGIWADLTLYYERFCFRPYPWSFPDFKSGMYNDIFLAIRALYKKKRKARLHHQGRGKQV